jgi:hypothetical protein
MLWLSGVPIPIILLLAVPLETGGLVASFWKPQ